MIGKVSIKKVSNITGKEELVFEGQNQITEGLKQGADMVFKDGLPKEFLTKVHK